MRGNQAVVKGASRREATATVGAGSITCEVTVSKIAPELRGAVAALQSPKTAQPVQIAILPATGCRRRKIRNEVAVGRRGKSAIAARKIRAKRRSQDKPPTRTGGATAARNPTSAGEVSSSSSAGAPAREGSGSGIPAPDPSRARRGSSPSPAACLNARCRLHAPHAAGRPGQGAPPPGPPGVRR